MECRITWCIWVNKLCPKIHAPLTCALGHENASWAMFGHATNNWNFPLWKLSCMANRGPNVWLSISTFPTCHLIRGHLNLKAWSRIKLGQKWVKTRCTYEYIQTIANSWECHLNETFWEPWFFPIFPVLVIQFKANKNPLSHKNGRGFPWSHLRTKIAL